MSCHDCSKTSQQIDTDPLGIFVDFDQILSNIFGSSHLVRVCDLSSEYEHVSRQCDKHEDVDHDGIHPRNRHVPVDRQLLACPLRNGTVKIYLIQNGGVVGFVGLRLLQLPGTASYPVRRRR